MTLEALQERLGYVFEDPTLLELALTHRSWAVENARAGGPPADNERLEFLGDAVLELVTTEALMNRFPRAPEGQLSQIRAALVRTSTLARVAEGLELGAALRLGVGEEQSGGRDRPKVLSDALEAIFGAIYQDGGLRPCKRLLNHAWRYELSQIRDPARFGKDPKSALQERTQRSFGVLPRYELPEVEGPAHSRRYRIRVSVRDEQLVLVVDAWGEGTSKQNAQRAAAAAALALLDAQGR